MISLGSNADEGDVNLDIPPEYARPEKIFIEGANLSERGAKPMPLIESEEGDAEFEKVTDFPEKLPSPKS